LDKTTLSGHVVFLVVFLVMLGHLADLVVGMRRDLGRIRGRMLDARLRGNSDSDDGRYQSRKNKFLHGFSLGQTVAKSRSKSVVEVEQASRLLPGPRMTIQTERVLSDSWFAKRTGGRLPYFSHPLSAGVSSGV
jgi:hypothetical protein